jgi:phosphate starvation-inducible PhoH-like protein
MTQVDLPRNQRSGLSTAARILRNIDGIGHIELDEEDVVRHRLVKHILRAYNKEYEKETPQDINRATPPITKKEGPGT